jgi:hypothetical protein
MKDLQLYCRKTMQASICKALWNKLVLTAPCFDGANYAQMHLQEGRGWE